MTREDQISREGEMIRAGLDCESMQHWLNQCAAQNEKGDEVTLYLRSLSGRFINSTSVEISRGPMHAIEQARADFEKTNPKVMKGGNYFITFD